MVTLQKGTSCGRPPSLPQSYRWYVWGSSAQRRWQVQTGRQTTGTHSLCLSLSLTVYLGTGCLISAGNGSVDPPQAQPQSHNSLLPPSAPPALIGPICPPDTPRSGSFCSQSPLLSLDRFSAVAGTFFNACSSHISRAGFCSS